MLIHDISLPLSESIVVWSGDPPVHMSQPSHLDRGDVCTVTRLDMGAHTGTHVDAPAHFISGAKGVDSLDLDLLIGPAQVVDAGDVGLISARVLAGLSISPGTQRLIIRTRNSEQWTRGEMVFNPDLVGVAEDGARWLIENGVRLVGIDSLSVAPYDDTVPTHLALLGAGIIVVEGLDLNQIAPGTYQFVCLPLKLVGCDGAPARVVLIEGN
jgi:arylformamidase